MYYAATCHWSICGAQQRHTGHVRRPEKPGLCQYLRRAAISARGRLAAQQAAGLWRPAKTLLPVRVPAAIGPLPIQLRLRHAGGPRLQQWEGECR